MNFSVSKTLVTPRLQDVLSRFPAIQVAALFGSMARGAERADSDIDVAVQADKPLSVELRMAITEALALAFNRPVDLIDLRTAGQPLLGQIIGSGIQVMGSKHQWGDLVYRNIMEHEDFAPYQKRILEGRRNAWMNPS